MRVSVVSSCPASGLGEGKRVGARVLKKGGVCSDMTDIPKPSTLVYYGRLNSGTQILNCPRLYAIYSGNVAVTIGFVSSLGLVLRLSV